MHTGDDTRYMKMALEAARAGRDVCWTDDGVEEPLVTVRIATYDRGPLVAERALEGTVRA